MNKYETIFVVDSLLKPDEIESIITKYQRFISANGGQIKDTEPWGKKRLSYEIKKRQYGYFVLIRFQGPASMIKQLEREYRLNESVLRFMTLRLSKQALKSLEGEQKRVAQPAPKPQPVKEEKVTESAAEKGSEQKDAQAPEEKEAEPAKPESEEQIIPEEPVAETVQENEKEQAPEEKKAEE